MLRFLNIFLSSNYFTALIYFFQLSFRHNSHINDYWLKHCSAYYLCELYFDEGNLLHWLYRWQCCCCFLQNMVIGFQYQILLKVCLKNLLSSLISLPNGAKENSKWAIVIPMRVSQTNKIFHISWNYLPQ